MPHIFCIANQKGGVGKTTSAVNLAAALALMEQRVLFVDLDPQGNGTMGCGIDKNELEASVYELLVGSKSFEDVVVKTESGFDVLPANRELAGAEVELVGMQHRDARLKIGMHDYLHNYDYVLIDCPPSLSMLTLNALCLSTGVIIPMQCEYYAMEGLRDLVETVKRVRLQKNRALTHMWILRVMFDPRISLQQQVSEQLKHYFGKNVFDTMIPRNVRLAEAPSHGMPGVLYDKLSKGAQAYRAAASELLKRMG